MSDRIARGEIDRDLALERARTPQAVNKQWLSRRLTTRAQASSAGYCKLIATLAARKMSVEELAGAVGIGAAYLSRVLRGQQPLGARLRAQIADYLCLAPDELSSQEVPIERAEVEGWAHEWAQKSGQPEAFVLAQFKVLLPDVRFNGRPPDRDREAFYKERLGARFMGDKPISQQTFLDLAREWNRRHPDGHAVTRESLQRDYRRLKRRYLGSADKHRVPDHA